MQRYITEDWNAIFFSLNILKSALLLSWVGGKYYQKNYYNVRDYSKL